MARMSEKRKRHADEWTRKTLCELTVSARENPDQFRARWNERLQWRACVMRRLAHNLSGPAVLTQVDEAIEELRWINPPGKVQEVARTEATLTAAGCAAIAAAVDRRLQKLTARSLERGAFGRSGKRSGDA
jgi:hypothetical protein